MTCATRAFTKRSRYTPTVGTGGPRQDPQAMSTMGGFTLAKGGRGQTETCRQSNHLQNARTCIMASAIV